MGENVIVTPEVFIVSNNNQTQEIVVIHSQLPTNKELKEVKENLTNLKIALQKSIIEGKHQCCQCGVWQFPWQGCDSGSGFGYNCKSNRDAQNPFSWRSYEKPNPMMVFRQLKVPFPIDKEDRIQIAKNWIDGMAKFAKWIDDLILSQSETVNATFDLSKLTNEEEECLARLLKKAKRK